MEGPFFISVHCTWHKKDTSWLTNLMLADSRLIITPLPQQSSVLRVFQATFKRRYWMERSGYNYLRFRVQRKSVLHPAIRASCSEHVIALKSFQLAPKPFLMSRIDCNPSVIWICPKNSTCPSRKLRTKITSPIAKSTSPRLSDTTFFARWGSTWESNLQSLTQKISD